MEFLIPQTMAESTTFDICTIKDKLDAFIHELEDIDASFDYYEFDGPETETSFKRFCDIDNVKYEVVSRFSAADNGNIISYRVPFPDFTEAAGNINPDLDGNIETIITGNLMKKLL